MFTYVQKRSYISKLFSRERFNESLKLLKSAKKYFSPTFPSICVNLRWKKSFLVWFEILGVLVNTFTADYEYSGSNTYNLPLPFKTQVSEKLETFSPFFITFLEYALNVQDFFEKTDSQSSTISEVIDSQSRVSLRA